MHLLLFDIGGTDIKYGIVDQFHRFIAKDKMATDISSGGFSILNQVISIAKDISLSYVIDGIGISSAGVIDPVHGIVLSATDTIPNFAGVRFKESFEQALNIKTTVINDVNAMALCEAYFGDHAHHSFLALTIGTGIGGAIVVNDHIYHGVSMSAGEWGRMYLDGEKFEHQASLSSIVKKANDMGLTCQNAFQLFEFYDQKNEMATDIISTFYHQLAKGIANLIYAFNPPLILIGGGISNRGQKMIDEVKFALSKVLEPYFIKSCEIALASQLNDAGMLGAMIHFKQTIQQKKP
jgi:predicted NBD/HSP70 family sugar kinase